MSATDYVIQAVNPWGAEIRRASFEKAASELFASLNSSRSVSEQIASINQIDAASPFGKPIALELFDEQRREIQRQFDVFDSAIASTSLVKQLADQHAVTAKAFELTALKSLQDPSAIASTSLVKQLADQHAVTAKAFELTALKSLQDPSAIATTSLVKQLADQHAVTTKAFELTALKSLQDPLDAFAKRLARAFEPQPIHAPLRVTRSATSAPRKSSPDATKNSPPSPEPVVQSNNVVQAPWIHTKACNPPPLLSLCSATTSMIAAELDIEQSASLVSLVSDIEAMNGASVIDWKDHGSRVLLSVLVGDRVQKMIVPRKHIAIVSEFHVYVKPSMNAPESDL